MVGALFETNIFVGRRQKLNAFFLEFWKKCVATAIWCTKGSRVARGGGGALNLGLAGSSLLLSFLGNHGYFFCPFLHGKNAI